MVIECVEEDDNCRATLFMVYDVLRRGHGGVVVATCAPVLATALQLLVTFELLKHAALSFHLFFVCVLFVFLYYL